MVPILLLIIVYFVLAIAPVVFILGQNEVKRFYKRNWIYFIYWSAIMAFVSILVALAFNVFCE